MPQGQVLEFSGVTKRFGAVTAVDEFTARVEPGLVTGFLGPNGAGKTTTLRILLGLVKATSGTATIGGLSYAHLRNPLQTVGSVLEASSFHPGRSGAAHLRVYAQAAGLPDSRVDETLGMVGLADVGGRKVGGYSLGMRQRLGLAYALLGDPGVLVLDEPANGLDPEGIKWMRGLLRELARQGRTVLVSSHLLAEVQQTVDSLLIISQGRLVFQGRLDELTDPTEYATVVDASDRAALSDALHDAGVEFELLRSGLVVRGVDTGLIGQAAAAGGVALTLLQRRGPALEEVFLDLVSGVRTHASASVDGAEDAVAGAEDAADAEDAVAGAEDAAAGAEDAADAEDAVDGAEDAAAAADATVAEAEHAPLAEAELAVQAVAEPAEADAADSAAGFVVASTGIIDIIPSGAEEAEPAAAVEADLEPDVEPGVEPGVEPSSVASAAVETPIGEDGSDVSEGDEIEAIDAALEQPIDDAPPADAPALGDDGATDGPPESDRPWENYVRTDADLEADRFFAAFDADGVAITAPPSGDAGSAPGAVAPATAEDAASAPASPEAEEGDSVETAFDLPPDEPEDTASDLPPDEPGDTASDLPPYEPEQPDREADDHEEGGLR
ncbi:ABC transporter ATP-binding protein [Microbacterium ulmi]|uniref:ABC transporter ATP-binding protein n=1 Tax=Microbacterium ulmi TaxID=179095 RepID=A0A7Y2M266_9MICO|nr:ABC transporter ATP-binding protein [Microbacterium ulmi]NII69135.1 ABC-type multidrug transport system ATPase subunit [Microbacterium ulmi]NNH05146.1 ABC transporter ATP-binding protein [Microbacterium ulmi]